MTRSPIRSVALAGLVLTVACTDGPTDTAVSTTSGRSSARSSGAGIPIPPIVDLRGDISDVRSDVPVSELPEVLTDQELVSQIRASGGLVFVGFKPTAALRTKVSGVFPGMSRGAALAARAQVLARKDVRLVRSFATDATIVVELPPETGPLLRSMGVVNFIEPVREVRLARADSIPWGVQKIGAPTVWSAYGNTGASASVSFLDSGMDEQHFGAELPATLHCYYDSVSFTGQFANCWDQDGHGSHVMGIASAQINSAGYIGVAPSSENFASFKVCADPIFGGCHEDAIVSALWWIEANANWPRHVVNLSLGGPSISSTWANAISRLYNNKGVLIVAAAGNSPNQWGFGGVMYPARLSSVIAVSGTLESDQFASAVNCGGYVISSNTGADVEISAPFRAISTVVGGQYDTKCGTSMSTPHVSATAMLVWSQYPSWNNVQVRSRLTQTALDLGSPGRDAQFGFGRVSAIAAAAPPPPPQHWATISGPFGVKPWAQCTWTFSTSVESPNIEWTVNGVVVGTTETLYYSASDPFVLQVSLWNPSNGTGASDLHSVNVASGNPDCNAQ